MNLNNINTGQKLLRQVPLRNGLTERHWMRQKQLELYRLQNNIPTKDTSQYWSKGR